MTEQRHPIGIIGGTGLNRLEGLELKEHWRETPFGTVQYSEAEMEGRRVYFVPRHEEGHLLSPHIVNYKANIALLRMEGCKAVIGFSSVGSMKDYIGLGDIVVPDDWESHNVFRPSSFFEERGAVGHVEMEPPTCATLREKVIEAAHQTGNNVFDEGIYLCIQGPPYTTRKQTRRLEKRFPEAAVIGMCIDPEIKLAREAGMCYVMVARATDYNHLEGKPAVSTEEVKKIAAGNAALTGQIIEKIVREYDNPECWCHSAPGKSVITYRPRMVGEHKAMFFDMIGCKATDE